MAVGTLAKGYSRVARLSVRPRRMAFLAGHLRVQSSQRIARLGMVEFLDRADRFPVGEVVALLAIRPQTALVGILMTRDASLRNAQEGLVQVLYLDHRMFRGRNMIGSMTAVTGQARVFRLQRISGLFVIKGAGIPLHDWKIFSVVVGVAAYAILARPRVLLVGGVEPAVSRDARGNLRVTLQTLEGWFSSGKLVAGCAVARTV